MKRRIAKTCVFLLLGAIVSVAVAWACDVRGAFSYSSTPALGIKPADRVKMPPASFPYEFAPEWKKEGRGFGQHRVRYEDDSRARMKIFAEEFRVGWPLRCVYGVRWIAYGARHTDVVGARASRFILKDSVNTRHVLPWLPILPGFAMNTVAYGSILWALFVIPGLVRRRIRARRGVCPACAYPIGTNPVCTECGKPVKGKCVESTPPQ